MSFFIVAVVSALGAIYPRIVSMSIRRGGWSGKMTDQMEDQQEEEFGSDQFVQLREAYKQA